MRALTDDYLVTRACVHEKGDLIATGTPAGIAPVQVGDEIEVEVEGVGVLRNRVAAAES